MRHYHLAQINVGRIRGPIDSGIMAEFVANLDPVNAVAEKSPGFLWRFQTEEGNATSVQIFDDPMQLLNFSVWESIETLSDFVYKSAHTPFLRRRFEWFEKFEKPYVAMWWVPAGYIPTVFEARDRLEFLQRHGETPVAFSFRKRFPAPDAPQSAAAAEPPFSYHDRKFAVQINSAGAHCTPETRFHYRQSGPRVWATYQGGDVRFGSLVAVTDASGGLDMRYHHVDPTGTLRTGTCQSRPEFVDGCLRLYETWRRTSDDLSGHSILEEIR